MQIKSVLCLLKMPLNWIYFPVSQNLDAISTLKPKQKFVGCCLDA